MTRPTNGVPCHWLTPTRLMPQPYGLTQAFTPGAVSAMAVRVR